MEYYLSFELWHLYYSPNYTDEKRRFFFKLRFLNLFVQEEVDRKLSQYYIVDGISSNLLPEHFARKFFFLQALENFGSILESQYPICLRAGKDTLECFQSRYLADFFQILAPRIVQLKFSADSIPEDFDFEGLAFNNLKSLKLSSYTPKNIVTKPSLRELTILAGSEYEPRELIQLVEENPKLRRLDFTLLENFAVYWIPLVINNPILLRLQELSLNLELFPVYSSEVYDFSGFSRLRQFEIVNLLGFQNPRFKFPIIWPQVEQVNYRILLKDSKIFCTINLGKVDARNFSLFFEDTCVSQRRIVIQAKNQKTWLVRNLKIYGKELGRFNHINGVVLQDFMYCSQLSISNCLLIPEIAVLSELKLDRLEMNLSDFESWLKKVEKFSVQISNLHLVSNSSDCPVISQTLKVRQLTLHIGSSVIESFFISLYIRKLKELVAHLEGFGLFEELILIIPRSHEDEIRSWFSKFQKYIHLVLLD
jgi:hypothetical protein